MNEYVSLVFQTCPGSRGRDTAPITPQEECQGNILRRAVGMGDTAVATFGEQNLP